MCLIAAGLCDPDYPDNLQWNTHVSSQTVGARESREDAVIVIKLESIKTWMWSFAITVCRGQWLLLDFIEAAFL